MKADFDIVYKNIMRRHDSTSMDFYAFLDGIENLAQRIYKNVDLGESIESFLTEANEYFESKAKATWFIIMKT